MVTVTDTLTAKKRRQFMADNAAYYPVMKNGINRLRTGEVHIWSVSFSAEQNNADYFYRVLSEQELDHARNFNYKKDMMHYLISRGILRCILGNYIGVSPSLLKLKYKSTGKPLPEDNKETVYYDISHSIDMAVMAFSRDSLIGIDIEKIREIPDMQEIAARCFNRTDYAVYAKTDEVNRAKVFFMLWTRQEALMKAQSNSKESNAMVSDPLYIKNLKPAKGYTGALALNRHSYSAIFRHWESAVMIDQQELFVNKSIKKTLT